MKNYQDFLMENPNGTMATVAKDAAATRIFQVLWVENDKVYFCTSNEKPVYAQIKAKPNVSFCTWNPATFESASVNGKAVFVDDLAGKTRALNENPPIKGIYGEPTNPVFELLYIDVAEVETFSFTEGGNSIRIK